MIVYIGELRVSFSSNASGSFFPNIQRLRGPRSPFSWSALPRLISEGSSCLILNTRQDPATCNYSSHQCNIRIKVKGMATNNKYAMSHTFIYPSGVSFLYSTTLAHTVADRQCWFVLTTALCACSSCRSAHAYSQYCRPRTRGNKYVLVFYYITSKLIK